MASIKSFGGKLPVVTNVGIVEKVDNGIIYIVEGNSDDSY